MGSIKHMIQVYDLVKRHQLNCFIETGSNRGDGIAAAIESGLDRVFSCDLDQIMIDHCRSLFPRDSVKLYQGYSIEVLGKMCSECDGKALFFLDAHFPEFYNLDGGGHERYPIPEEIEIIKRSKKGYENDVIVVDDTRVIQSADNPRFRSQEEAGVAVVKNMSIKSIQDLLSDTHSMTHNFDNEGYLIFQPI